MKGGGGVADVVKVSVLLVEIGPTRFGADVTKVAASYIEVASLVLCMLIGSGSSLNQVFLGVLSVISASF